MKTEDNLESSTLKRRNSIGSSIDSSPTKRNFRRNSEKLQNKSFDDLNNSKYHVRTRSMLQSKSENYSMNGGISAGTQINNQVVKRLQKIRFEDSLSSPDNKRNFIKKISDAKEQPDQIKIEPRVNILKKSTILKTARSSSISHTSDISAQSSFSLTMPNQCPVIGCDSTGHLSGFPNSKHSTYDVCPIYNKLTVDQCNRLGPIVEKNYFNIINKLDTQSNVLNDEIDEEKLKYHENIKNQLKNILHIDQEKQFIPIENTSNIPPDILTSRSKNQSSNLILNSITNSMNLKSKKRSSKQQNSYIETPMVNDLGVSEFEFNLFQESLILSAQSNQINLNNGQIINQLSKLKPINPNSRVIQLGEYEIESWFKSPYPDDIWNQEKFFICQFCLKYIKSVSLYRRHLEKCLWKFPPGREIYRKDGYSFFEIDGNIDTIYCQNLCLLAKLFLDHKTLYLEVEPFLFYVLTKFNNEKSTFEMLGYFSKEKESYNNYNLSCILTLPQYMNQGYGRFLIDFSYLLTRIEGKTGSPEKPLSDLGIISYRNYWISVIINEIAKDISIEEISIKDLSNRTGILMNDIISSLQYIGLIKNWKGKYVIVKNQAIINKYMEKRRHSLLEADVIYLKWNTKTDQ